MNYYHLFSSPVPGLIFRDEEDFRTGVNLLAGRGKEMGESEGWKVLGGFIGKGEDLPEKERFCR